MSLRFNQQWFAGRKLSRTLAETLGWWLHRGTASLRRVVPGVASRDPKNLAVICDSFLRYGCAQAAGLREAGFNVTLYYVDRVDQFAGNEADRSLFLETAETAGVDVVPLPRRNMSRVASQVATLHRDLRRRKIALAVVHAHIDPRYATLGFVLPVAMVVHDPQIHSGDTWSTYPLPVRIMSRITELSSSCLVIHSERLINQLRPLLRRMPIAVVPHGAEMAQCPIPVPDKRRLLIFGRLLEYKGVDTALEAFRRLPASLSDAELVVAGRGPLASRARGMPNVQVREEYIADSELDDLLGEARLVLLAYKDATQSGVGLQAVARGVPCVVSSAGALPELVEDLASGLVVSPESPAQLAQAIVQNIDHGADLRLATYSHAADNFAWPVVAVRLRSELSRLGLIDRAVTDAPASAVAR